MKHRILLLVLTLGLVARSLAIEAGVYLISCAEVPDDRSLPMVPADGYLLTISDEGTATLVFANEAKVEFEEVKVVAIEGARDFVLNAKFTEDGSSNSILTLQFNGSRGKGVLVGTLRRARYLTARIGKLNQAEQDAAPQIRPR